MDEDMEKGKEDSESTDTSVKVKEEPKERADIKDFAETTMNELLGWYGYDKVVDHQDTENLDLHRFTSNTPGSGSRGSTPSTTGKGERPSRRDSGTPDDASIDSLARSTPSTGGQSDLAASHKNLVTALTGEKGKGDGCTAVGEREAIVCQWCQKPGVKLFTLKTADGTKGFCSELCFTLCRRASFKKNKLCDWCKHVRHTVSFVDFQDGDQQLQFCSDKCLNQYKMNIFCKETQEHLQQIQSQVDASKLAPSPGGNGKQILITPDLWVKEQAGESSASPRAKSADREKSSEQKAKETMSSESLAPKPVYHSRSSLYDRHSSSRDDSLQRSRADLTSPVASTSKSSHEHYERSMYPSERERLRRLKSRDSSSSTPISLTASPVSSQISTPRCSASNDISKTVLNPSLISRPGQTSSASTAAAATSLSSLSQSESHLMYHPLLAAGLGGGIPGLLPQAMMPPMPMTAIPPPQPLVPPKETSTSDTNGQSTGPSAREPAQTQAAGPYPHPPPLYNPAFWNPMAGAMPGISPYSQFPGGYMPAMPPNPFASMMPPNTLMMPYPIVVPVPLPLPIPIPIPIPMKEPVPPIDIKPEPVPPEPSRTPTSMRSSHLSPRHKSPGRPSAGPSHEGSSHSHHEHARDVEDRSADEHNEKNCENKPAGKIACACCQQTTTDTLPMRSVSRSSSDAGSFSTSRSPSNPTYFSESQPSRLLNGHPILVMPHAEEQTDVIDLSKDSKHSSIPSPLSDVDHNKNSMPLSLSPSSNGHDHVVGPHPAPLPPLPADPRYSARRSLILDAPSVPRDKNRSPSPGEKRMYYGSSQALYGKRRCIRTRIKTK